MFYCKVLLLLAATTDVFGHSLRGSSRAGNMEDHPIPISDVPFMVSLWNNETMQYACGGTIINEKFILTAAHCCFQHLIVAIGTDNDQEGVLYDVHKSIPHQGYIPSRFNDDICLLKLNENIKYGPNVGKVTLTGRATELKKGVSFDAIRWGNSEQEGNWSDILRVEQMSFVDHTECKRIYGNKITDDKVFCAASKEKRESYDDSGEVLLLNNKQVGIAVTGINGGEYSTVYTKVSAYIQWITYHVTRNM